MLSMNDSKPDPYADLEAWVAVLAERFELDASQLPLTPILDLTRDIAYGVARPAAPVSAYIVGLVAGMAGGSGGDINEAITAVLQMMDTDET